MALQSLPLWPPLVDLRVQILQDPHLQSVHPECLISIARVLAQDRWFFKGWRYDASLAFNWKTCKLPKDRT